MAVYAGNTVTNSHNLHDFPLRREREVSEGTTEAPIAAGKPKSQSHFISRMGSGGRIAQELPELTARDQMRKDAREEHTLSGELRRAIHDSELSLAEIAALAGVTPMVLDDFLTGERTLRSDVIDRLTIVLGYELHPSR